MFLVIVQMETNLKDVDFFEILDGDHLLLHPAPKHIWGVILEQLCNTS